MSLANKTPGDQPASIFHSAGSLLVCLCLVCHEMSLANKTPGDQPASIFQFSWKSAGLPVFGLPLNVILPVSGLPKVGTPLQRQPSFLYFQFSWKSAGLPASGLPLNVILPVSGLPLNVISKQDTRRPASQRFSIQLEVCWSPCVWFAMKCH